jgi:hypothetical protein
MLRTNISYAAINTWSSQMQTQVATQITNANALLTAVQAPGFHVSVYTTTTPVSTVLSGAVGNVSLVANVVHVSLGTMPVAFTPTSQVVLYGLTGATFLNGVPLTVTSSTTTSFSAAFTAPDYPSAQDTGVALNDTPLNAWASAVTDVNFDTLVAPTDFDFTGNITTLAPGLFTIQSAGTYVGFAVVDWNITNVSGDTVTAMILQNGVPIAVNVQSTIAPGTVTASLSFTGTFAHGDTVQVVGLSQNASESIVPGVPAGTTQFGMIQTT